MTYEEIIRYIETNLPDNQQKRITARDLRDTLKEMLDYSEDLKTDIECKLDDCYFGDDETGYWIKIGGREFGLCPKGQCNCGGGSGGNDPGGGGGGGTTPPPIINPTVTIQENVPSSTATPVFQVTIDNPDGVNIAWRGIQYRRTNRTPQNNWTVQQYNGQNNQFTITPDTTEGGTYEIQARIIANGQIITSEDTLQFTIQDTENITVTLEVTTVSSKRYLKATVTNPNSVRVIERHIKYKLDSGTEWQELTVTQYTTKDDFISSESFSEMQPGSYIAIAWVTTANGTYESDPFTFTIQQQTLSYPKSVVAIYDPGDSETAPSINISWGPVEGAVKYNIYKFNSTTQKYEYLDFTTDTTYEDAYFSIGDNKYVVTAVDKYNNESARSDSASYTYSPSTQIELPQVTTGSAASNEITFNSAICHGTLVSDGGDPWTTYGICYIYSPGTWGYNATPTVDNGICVQGNPSNTKSLYFNAYLNDLPEDKNIKYRAYATNAAGTAYGNVKSFGLPQYQVPGITIEEPFNVGSDRAYVTVTINNTGDATSRQITEIGVFWQDENNVANMDLSTTPQSNISYTQLNNSSLEGTQYTFSLTNLQSNTKYYVIPYVKYNKLNVTPKTYQYNELVVNTTTLQGEVSDDPIYGPITITEFSYDVIDFNGGNAMPFISWTQTVTQNGQIGIISNQGTVSYMMTQNPGAPQASISTSTGRVTVSTANTNSNPLIIGTVSVTVSNQGFTAQAQYMVTQGVNDVYLDNNTLYYTTINLTSAQSEGIANGNTTLKQIFDSNNTGSTAPTYMALEYDADQVYHLTLRRDRAFQHCIIVFAIKPPTNNVYHHVDLTNMDYPVSVLSDFSSNMPDKCYYEENDVTVHSNGCILTSGAKVMLVLNNISTSSELDIIIKES